MNTTHFDRTFGFFLEAAEAVITEYWDNAGFSGEAPNLTFTEGRKYIKVIRCNSTGKKEALSVHCFVDKTNGNILKANSWKAPCTRNPRGNIFDADCGASAMTPFGVHYL